MPSPARNIATFTIPQIAALMALLISLPLLWFPWIRTGLAGEVRLYTAFQIFAVGHVVAALTCGALAVMVWGSRAGTWRRRSTIIPVAALTVTALPGLVLIGLVEFVHSFVPSWLTPFVTNSASMALRAGPGVWAHSGLIVVALTLWLAAPSMTSEGEVVNPRRAKGKVLLLLSTVALVVVRSLPLFTVSVRRGEELGVGQPLATVGIVAGEVPLLGLLSTLVTMLFLALVILAVLTPHPLMLIVTSIALGAHLGLIWMQVVSVKAAAAVIPSGWIDLLDDWVAVGVTVSPGAVAALGFSSLGFLGILLMLTPPRPTPALAIPAVRATAISPDSGSMAFTTFDDLP